MVLRIIGFLSLVALSLLTWVSLAQPFPTDPIDWNYLTSSSLNLLAATGAATAGLFVLRQFGADEKPFRIWLTFTLGLWSWVIGQAIVFGFDVTGTAYPEGLTFIDLLWILGYISLGLSLYFQLTRLYDLNHKKRVPLYLVLVLVALLVTVWLTNLAIRAGLGEGSFWFVVFVSVLYPVFDLAEGTGAIWLSLLFGRGQWSRPWWGLIFFALADAVDTFYWVGGWDLVPPMVQSVLNFISSTFSFGGYLVIGFALTMNYFILQYGYASGLLKTRKMPEIPPPPVVS